jgi:hypothetical protein
MAATKWIPEKIPAAKKAKLIPVETVWDGKGIRPDTL